MQRKYCDSRRNKTTSRKKNILKQSKQNKNRMQEPETGMRNRKEGRKKEKKKRETKKEKVKKAPPPKKK